MRIAIVKLSALGDIIHAMVILQYVKKFNKEIIIDWIVEERYTELLANNPHINKVHSINLKKAKKKRSLNILISELLKLRKIGSYDIVIDMQGLTKSAICAWLIPSLSTLGFDKDSSRERFASFFYTNTFNFGYEENVVVRNFEIIKYSMGFLFNQYEIQSKEPFVFPSKKFEYFQLSNVKKNVVIIPGASHQSKLYPTNKFVKLTQSIDANFIVIWGSEIEKNLAKEIKVSSPRVNITDKLSIDQLISLISQVDLVIGADTGPTHLAWALNIPSISLFGSTPGYRNTYGTKINKILESKSIVNPLNIIKNDYSIKNIEVQEIVKIASLFLKK
jgi:heptosyltransferase I